MNKRLDEFVKEHNGYLITSILEEKGFSRQSVIQYAKKNNFERVAQGIYISNEIWPDNLYISQLKNKETVYSFETALYLHGLMEKEPAFTNVTVNYGYNATHLKNKGIKVHTAISNIYNIGIESVRTQFGNIVKTYDMERTICDIVKYKKHMDIQVFTTALKEYAKSKDKNIPVLMDYAKKLRVSDKLRTYLEVLL